MSVEDPTPELPELARCLSEPGYTPPNRALRALLDALIAAPEQQVPVLERALARSGPPVLQAAAQMLAERGPEERPRLFGLFSRLAGEAGGELVYDTLLGALDESDVQSRKLAARGLAKLADARAETRLLEGLSRSSGPERKSIVDA
ncbi:MAG TPA: hypothetical protein VMG12_39585, partial [Polyangiaceae bacterium]|nr:hypothetical protein [Polyangiaceae bacterium]